jgi:hypothetical protein
MNLLRKDRLARRTPPATKITPELAAHPGKVGRHASWDYFYMSLTISMAFSPTDAMPRPRARQLVRRCKLQLVEGLDCSKCRTSLACGSETIV